MWKLTRRDKRLLIGLLLFCAVSGLVFLVILPLRAANQEWEELLASYEDQTALIRRKTELLPELEAECEAERARVKELQASLYPVMEAYELDGLLTGQVTAAGARIMEMKLGTLRETDEQGLLLTASVELELSGARETLEGLLGMWSRSGPGMRIAGFIWGEDRVGENSETLRVRLEFWMYGDGMILPQTEPLHGDGTGGGSQ